ncbi:MAG: ankyrin repeat domain-containing protein, partial [Legionellales bacterium]
MTLSKFTNDHYYQKYGENALHQAVNDGNLAEVEKLVRLGCDINKPYTIYGSYPIFFAARKGHVKIVEHLFKCRSILYSDNDDLLFSASYCSNPERRNDLIKFILENKIHEQINLTEIQKAAFLGDNQKLEALLKQEKTTRIYIAELAYAAVSNNMECFKLIEQRIEDGISIAICKDLRIIIECYIEKLEIDPSEAIKTGGNSGLQPIHIAAYFGRVEIVDYLAQQLKNRGKSTNPAAKEGDGLGLTPLWVAAKNNQLDIVKYCVEKLGIDPSETIKTGIYAGMQSIHIAAYFGRVEIVDYLSQQLKNRRKSANPAANDGESLGCTSLWFAIKNNQLDVIKYYIEKLGIDPSETIKTGIYAGMQSIHIAACFSHVRIIDYLAQQLKSRGKSANSVVSEGDGLGYTPLVYAIKNNQLDVVKCYVEKLGIDPSENIEGGENAKLQLIHIAAYFGRVEIVDYLAQQLKSRGKSTNPAVNSGYRLGYTPLWYAIKNDQLDVVKCYIEKLGIDPSETIKVGEDAGKEPIHIAACFGHVRIIDYLAQQLTSRGKSANPAVSDGDDLGYTPSWYAAMKNQ